LFPPPFLERWRLVLFATILTSANVFFLTNITGHQHDQRGRLAGLPKLFDELIRAGEEPLDAVRTMVCLLAGEERGEVRGK
jgi:hypothetical protein